MLTFVQYVASEALDAELRKAANECLLACGYPPVQFQSGDNDRIASAA